jgi:hypothetical protein
MVLRGLHRIDNMWCLWRKRGTWTREDINDEWRAFPLQLHRKERRGRSLTDAHLLISGFMNHQSSNWVDRKKDNWKYSGMSHFCLFSVAHEWSYLSIQTQEILSTNNIVVWVKDFYLFSFQCFQSKNRYEWERDLGYRRKQRKEIKFENQFHFRPRED